MKRPFVFINVAMTADGKIDTVARKGAAISSPRDKERVDQLRAGSDAVHGGRKNAARRRPEINRQIGSVARGTSGARACAESRSKWELSRKQTSDLIQNSYTRDRRES